jgi:murein DD-endopeptidase MepM/ murein hydrolase activator NlpD
VIRAGAIRLAILGAAVLAVSATLAAAAPPPREAATDAEAAIVRITIPGQDPVTLGQVSWPEAPSAEVQSFAYPNDGSVVTVGLSRASVSAQTGSTAAAQSSAEATALSLFGGDVLAGEVTAHASAGASRRSAGADAGRSSIQGLRVLGQDVTPSPGTAALGDWGTLEMLAQDTGSRRGSSPAAQGSVVVLRLRLILAHAGLAPGSEIVVGAAEATAAAEAIPATPEPPRGVVGTPSPGTRPFDDRIPSPPEPDTGDGAIPGGPVRAAPPEVDVKVTLDGYVFPVFGAASFGDSFGAPRADVPGRWHHGEDIFAPLGAPLLAVADGTVHSIGFIPIGGYRLWLRDKDGNEFYYAHLSAYSPLAVEGNAVKAGDVIGFVGSTGDAEGGTPHLHFEIHPSAMVGLGYDGVIAPYPFLVAWRRVEDVSFAAGRIYVPAGGPSIPTLPPPGAVLLQAEDIASLSGLVPGALERALERKRD